MKKPRKPRKPTALFTKDEARRISDWLAKRETNVTRWGPSRRQRKKKQS